MVETLKTLTAQQWIGIGIFIALGIMAVRDKIAAAFHWVRAPEADGDVTATDALAALETLGKWGEQLDSKEFRDGLAACRQHFLCEGSQPHAHQ